MLLNKRGSLLWPQVTKGGGDGGGVAQRIFMIWSQRRGNRIKEAGEELHLSFPHGLLIGRVW